MATKKEIKQYLVDIETPEPIMRFLALFNQIDKYFDEQGLSGYNYAYLNPGMNKIMQALGRVIRSEEDKGAVLLIDERYLTNEYRDLFKAEWREYEVVFTPKEVSDICKEFFNK